MSKQMLNLSLDLPLCDGALQGVEVSLPDPGARAFRVAIGGDDYAIEVRHLPELAPYAGQLPEEPRRPDDKTVLALAAGLFFEGVKGGAR